MRTAEDDGDLMPADRSVARYNARYRSVGRPGRRVRLRAAADVELSPA
ncbi:hypothetical protein AB0896_19635 [Streptomyces parvulus]